MEAELQESDILARAERIMATDLPAGKIGKTWLTSPLRRKLELTLLIPTTPLALSIMAYAGALIASIDKFEPIIGIEKDWPPYIRSFTLAKLQTLRPDKEIEISLSEGDMTLTQLKRNGDPRITRLGKSLRGSSIDELPQIFNIIAGDMSLVGPRPFTNSEWSNEILPHQNKEPYRSIIKAIEDGYLNPGLTGLDGIFGRSNLDIETRFKLMYLYIQKASWIADLRIIGLTLPAVLSRRGAY